MFEVFIVRIAQQYKRSASQFALPHFSYSHLYEKTAYILINNIYIFFVLLLKTIEPKKMKKKLLEIFALIAVHIKIFILIIISKKEI